MFSKFWQIVGLNAVLFGGALTIIPLANANEEVIPFQEAETIVQLSSFETTVNPSTLAQVTSITQFRDVSPQTWSFQALKNLVENYGCIEGYPDRTYRGERPLSRYEFAAGLNSCLEALERRFLEVRESTPLVVEPAEPLGISLNEMFTRAFFNDTGTYHDLTSISGQANLIFGWRRAPGSFMDNMIARDGKLVNTIYDDAIRQQTQGIPLRTPDLPNPFDTSILENPSYLRQPAPAQPAFPLGY